MWLARGHSRKEVLVRQHYPVQQRGVVAFQPGFDRLALVRVAVGREDGVRHQLQSARAGVLGRPGRRLGRPLPLLRRRSTTAVSLGGVGPGTCASGRRHHCCPTSSAPATWPRRAPLWPGPAPRPASRAWPGPGPAWPRGAWRAPWPCLAWSCSLERRARSSKASRALLFPASRNVLMAPHGIGGLAVGGAVAGGLGDPLPPAPTLGCEQHRRVRDLGQLGVGCGGRVPDAADQAPIVTGGPRRVDEESGVGASPHAECQRAVDFGVAPFTRRATAIDVADAVDVDRPGLAGRDGDRRIQRNRELCHRPVDGARGKGATLHPAARVEFPGAVLGPRRGADVHRCGGSTAEGAKSEEVHREREHTPVLQLLEQPVTEDTRPLATVVAVLSVAVAMVPPCPPRDVEQAPPCPVPVGRSVWPAVGCSGGGPAMGLARKDKATRTRDSLL